MKRINLKIPIIQGEQTLICSFYKKLCHLFTTNWMNQRLPH